jgi:hypothetical protein
MASRQLLPNAEDGSTAFAEQSFDDDEAFGQWSEYLQNSGCGQDDNTACQGLNQFNEDRGCVQDAKGLCPGGLKQNEWNAVMNASLHNITSDEVEGEVLGLLFDGVVHSGIPWYVTLGRDRDAATAYGRIYIATNAFNDGPGDLAFLLVHESDHYLHGVSDEATADQYACNNTTGRYYYAQGSYDNGGGCR